GDAHLAWQSTFARQSAFVNLQADQVTVSQRLLQASFREGELQIADVGRELRLVLEEGSNGDEGRRYASAFGRFLGRQLESPCVDLQEDLSCGPCKRARQELSS